MSSNSLRFMKGMFVKTNGINDTMYRLAEIKAHLDAGMPCAGSRLYWEHAR
jgi:hypothetical protein